jgi:crotonobetainyl-CoA:carnitine CoA-transferase CaiB-like acyl-CoA transferase
MLSMSGMGQTGPWKDSVAFSHYSSIARWAYVSHLLFRRFSAWRGLCLCRCCRRPLWCHGYFGGAGAQDRPGAGQYIELSEYEAVCSMIGPALLNSECESGRILPTGNRSPHMPASPYGCYKCAGNDRWCVISVFEEIEWHALCRVSGHPEWAADERFSSLEMRKQHAEDLDRLLQAWTSRTEAEEVMQLLQSAGVPAGLFRTRKILQRIPNCERTGFSST